MGRRQNNDMRTDPQRHSPLPAAERQQSGSRAAAERMDATAARDNGRDKRVGRSFAPLSYLRSGYLSDLLSQAAGHITEYPYEVEYYLGPTVHINEQSKPSRYQAKCKVEPTTNRKGKKNGSHQ